MDFGEHATDRGQSEGQRRESPARGEDEKCQRLIRLGGQCQKSPLMGMRGQTSVSTLSDMGDGK